MSRLMSAWPATSSIDVLAKPCSTNARAAAPIMDSRRPASRGTSQVYTDAFTLGAMTTMQLDWTEEELLATHDVAEPLVCGGVRCHGGFDDEGGRKQMWFAARDVAFESPVTEDQTALMLERMGLSGVPGGGGAASAMLPPRLFPDIDGDLEMLISRMANLLLIEISAFH